jgi:AraC-like DNA-binding protein
VLIARATFHRLCRARERLHDDAASIREIAEDATISPYHFIRQFEALFGTTPHQYRIAARLEEAKRLLARGESVTDVCMAVGFSSLGSFSDLFARRVGTAPSRYRKLAAVPRVAFYRGCFELMALAIFEKHAGGGPRSLPA